MHRHEEEAASSMDRWHPGVSGRRRKYFPFRAQAANELEQHLRDQYKGKSLVLRGFYHGQHLTYDSAGMPIGYAVPGDWTVDGLVRVTSISVSSDRLAIQADVLALINDGHAFDSRSLEARRTTRRRRNYIAQASKLSSTPVESRQTRQRQHFPGFS